MHQGEPPERRDTAPRTRLDVKAPETPRSSGNQSISATALRISALAPRPGALRGTYASRLRRAPCRPAAGRGAGRGYGPDSASVRSAARPPSIVSPASPFPYRTPSELGMTAGSRKPRRPTHRAGFSAATGSSVPSFASALSRVLLGYPGSPPETGRPLDPLSASPSSFPGLAEDSWHRRPNRGTFASVHATAGVNGPTVQSISPSVPLLTQHHHGYCNER